MRTVDRKEEELFLRAIDISSKHERIAFLDNFCRNDAKLRLRIDKLLKFHESDSFILDTTFGSVPIDGKEEDPIGKRIGNYQLVREIGVGGMGIVYLAEQVQPVQRRVALKVIKLGMDTRSVIARFQAERQALALMEHPSITKVYDAGTTPTGRPFFVMELVNGPSITKYCDQKKLKLPDRLELFVQVCNAVQHAHQKGVIHRDIKPSNILVTDRDGKPLPKIIDFGIAKATTYQRDNDTRITDTVAMVGTPEYMSPEQADLGFWDLDTRSDIYSLGAVLYELCTGISPLKQDLNKKGFPHIREIIQTRQPRRPSDVVQQEESSEEICENRSMPARTLARMLYGDLDWIILKCLSKDRSLRYETANDLAREIERYLKGDPVDAIAPSFGYRCVKFASKHKKMLLTTIGIILVLAVSLFVSVRSTLDARSAARRAQRAEADAAERETEALRAWSSAEILKGNADRREKSLLEVQEHQKNQIAVARAIARFNGYARQLVVGSDPGTEENVRRQIWDLGISQSLRNDLIELQLQDIVIGSDLRNQKTQESNQQLTDRFRNDVRLLNLILEEQRHIFGGIHIQIAKSLDILGWRLLNLGRADEATDKFSDSLLIRTTLELNSNDRIHTMILLADALAADNKLPEAQKYLETATKRLMEKPAKERSERLLALIEKHRNKFK